MRNDRALWALALLAACGGSQRTPPGDDGTVDCYALLTEPAAVDCTERMPLSAKTLEGRAAARACLLDVNRAALARAQQTALQTNALTPANLPTVTYPERDTGERRHTREQLVALRATRASCLGGPLEPQSIVARDGAGQLVRIELVPEVTRTRRIESCTCAGCGPVPPPATVELAILPPGETVTRTITIAWPVQILDEVALMGFCA